MKISKLLEVAFFAGFLSFGFYAFARTPEKITIPKNLQKILKSFESSSVLHIEEENLYLISSDDTTKEDEPLLFWVKENEVLPSPARILGLEKMTDIESMSRVGDDFYFLSSMGLNKSMKEQPQRNLFVQARKDGMNFKVIQVVDLRKKVLESLIKLGRGSDPLSNTLDVESHFVLDGDLYIGLKAPQTPDGQATLLRLGQISDVFSKAELNTQVYKEIQFPNADKEKNLISDLYLKDGLLWITTVQEPQSQGRIWSFDPQTDQLTLKQEFPGLHPEGITYDSVLKKMIVVFDESLNGSLLLKF